MYNKTEIQKLMTSKCHEFSKEMGSRNYRQINLVKVGSNYRMKFKQMSYEHFERNVLTVRRCGVTKDKSCQSNLIFGERILLRL